MRRSRGLPLGMVAAVVVVTALALVISGDGLLLLPVAAALAVAGVMARSPWMRGRK